MSTRERLESSSDWFHLKDQRLTKHLQIEIHKRNVYEGARTAEDTAPARATW